MIVDIAFASFIVRLQPRFSRRVETNEWGWGENPVSNRAQTQLFETSLTHVQPREDIVAKPGRATSPGHRNETEEGDQHFMKKYSEDLNNT